MEAIAFAIGLEPIITRGQQLVDQYRTWKDNKEHAPELRGNFKDFKTDLDACITRLQKHTAALPQESRAIIDKDITTLTEHLASATAALESLNNRITRSPALRFFRAHAVAKDCDTLAAKLDEARKLIRDADEYVDLRSAVQRIEKGVDSLQTFVPASSSTATGSARAVRNAFHAYFDIPYDTSKLVFNFDSKDEDGNASTQEGKLLELLLRNSPNEYREIAVRGIGGVGKTCLLREMRSLQTVSERFRDGVYNIQLGTHATQLELIEALSTVVQSSGGEEKAESMRTETDIKKVMTMFRSWFANRQCLFIVDDVWQTKEIPSSTIHELIKLHYTGRDSKVLLATRSGEIASEADTYFCLEPRGPLEHESQAILLQYSGIEPEEGEEDDKNAVVEILKQCSGLPLFLAVSGKVVRTLSFRHGHGGCMAYHVYAESLQSSMQSLLSTDVGDYERLSARLMISIELLEERKQDLEFRIDHTMAEIHGRLSVMKKQTRVPMSMLKHLWELDNEEQAATVAREFEQVGLADVEFERTGSGVIELLRLHDSVYEFAVSETRKRGEERVGHETLVRGYGQCLTVRAMWGEWWRPCLEPDGYIHGSVCRHLLGSGRGSEAVLLLLKPQWAERQLNINGIPFLKDDLSLGIEAVHNGMEGYTKEECSETEKALQLISDAVTLSSPFVSRNNPELWFQLHGRLKRYGDSLRAIREYVATIETEVPRPVALCLNDFLGAPGAANTSIISTGVPLVSMLMLGAGDQVACGCLNGCIVFVNIHGSEVDKVWDAHSSPVFCSPVSAIAVGRNGTRLVSGAMDGTAKVWDVGTGQCVAIFEGHIAAVMGVAVLKDEKRVVSVSSDGTAKVWEMDTGRLVLPAIAGHEGGVSCVAVLGDRDEIITGGEDGKLRTWSATTGEQVGDPFEGHEKPISCVAVTPDECRVVSGSEDGTFRMWDVGSHEQVSDLSKGFRDPVGRVAVSKDGRRIVSASGLDGNKKIRVWDSESGQEVGDPLEPGETVSGVSFLESVDSIVSCSYDGIVRIWDVRRNKAERVADRHDSVVTGVSFTPNGKFVVSGSWDSTLRIWEPTTGQQFGDPLKGHSDSVEDVAVAPNGRWIISVSRDKTVGKWDFESRELLGKLAGHTDTVWCVAVTPNGNRAVTGSEDKTVRVWDLSAMDGSHVVLEGHSAAVRRVFITDDGLRIVSVDLKCEIMVWESQTMIPNWDIGTQNVVVKCLKVEDAVILSRQEVLKLIRETTIHDNACVFIPLHSRAIVYGERPPDAKFLATMECSVMSWALSPDKKTICIGLFNGQVAFLKLET